jgi:hypothetical protein
MKTTPENEPSLFTPFSKTSLRVGFNSRSKMVHVSALTNQIQGTVLLPGEHGFDQALKRWAVHAERNASIVALVTSAADVSATASSYSSLSNNQIKFATENNIPLTVRGGGHSASGASSIEGGLIGCFALRT